MGDLAVLHLALKRLWISENRQGWIRMASLYAQWWRALHRKLLRHLTRLSFVTR